MLVAVAVGILYVMFDLELNVLGAVQATADKELRVSDVNVRQVTLVLDRFLEWSVRLRAFET